MRRRKLTHVLLPLILVIMLGVHAEEVSLKGLQAIDGVYRLTDGTGESLAPTPLAGDWAFYWERFVDPESFDQATFDLLPEPDAFVHVPGSWNASPSPTALERRGDGYATYHLRVELPEEVVASDTLLALYIWWIPSAYRLWIDGELAAAIGTVGTTPAESDARILPRLVPFLPSDATVDIVLHVSNYEHRYGGLWTAPILGTYAEMVKAEQRRLAFDAALAGALILFALYHAALYLWVGRFAGGLYVALSAGLTGLRVLITGEYLLARLAGALPWTLTVRVEYLTGYLFIATFYGFLHATFPDECPRRITVAAQAFGVAGAAAATLLPMPLASSLIPLLTPVFAVLTLYAAGLFVLAVRNRRDGALLSLPGGIAVTMTMAHDLIHYNVAGFSVELWPVGVLILVLCQSLTVARRFALAVRRERRLAEENRRLLQEAAGRLDELRHSRRLIAQHDASLRRSIAERLHSGTQNRLLRALLRLDNAHASVASDPTHAASLIRSAQEDIEHVRTVDIRRISHQLHPSVVKAGLLAAVTSLADEYADTCTIRIEADAACQARDEPGEGGLSENLRLTVYRIVEEALGNIHAHAQARHVWIGLRCSENDLILEIRDDGRGFDPAETKPNLGLRIIDAAVTDCEGSWTIESAPGHGTALICRLPLMEEPTSSEERGGGTRPPR